jgi:guanine deaminase
MDDEWLDRAVRLAEQNVVAGGGPFGAVVVRDGVLLAEGQNRVTLDTDPTAHAEVVAIRRACATAGDFALDGCELFASCEPCPLCLCAAMWARLDRVVFAANRNDAALAGFSDLEFYALLERDRATWPMPVLERRVAGAESPFERWLATPGRTEY